MIANDDKIIYLYVPIAWNDIYLYFIDLLSTHGIDIIKDCNANCSKKGKDLIQCWITFQTACTLFNFNRQESIILFTIAVDCLNNKYNGKFDIDYYVNLIDEMDELPFICIATNSLFSEEFIELTGCHDYEELNRKAVSEHISLLELIYRSINEVKTSYLHDFRDSRKIIGDSYLYTEYDNRLEDSDKAADIFVIKISNSYNIQDILTIDYNSEFAFDIPDSMILFNDEDYLYALYYEKDVKVITDFLIKLYKNN